MGRKQRKAQQTAVPLPYVPEMQPAEPPGFADRVLALPRIVRLALAIVFALAAALAVTPLVDTVYINNFFSMETRMAPALVSSLLGFGVYFVGWRLIVGMVGETPRPRPAVRYYVLLGAALLVLVIVLLVIGIASNLDVLR